MVAPLECEVEKLATRRLLRGLKDCAAGQKTGLGVGGYPGIMSDMSLGT